MHKALIASLMEEHILDRFRPGIQNDSMTVDFLMLFKAHFHEMVSQLGKLQLMSLKHA